MGFDDAATLIEKAVEKTIQDGIVTYDLARQMKEVKPVSSSRFGSEVAKRM
jgi:isocitrate dehydrogenase